MLPPLTLHIYLSIHIYTGAHMHAHTVRPPTAVLMMNHSNLLDLKQNEAVTVSWGGPHWFQEEEWGVLCLLFGTGCCALGI